MTGMGKLDSLSSSQIPTAVHSLSDSVADSHPLGCSLEAREHQWFPTLCFTEAQVPHNDQSEK